MKKSGDKGSFGAPKPLPGQAGYNVLESNVLEKEAKDMESRLQMLQDRMKQQQIDESANKTGSKWKSSSKEKGSVSSYGKELQEKHKKRSEADGGGDPVLRATATGRRMQRDTSVKTFRSQDVEFWSVADVGEWLNYIQMGQYATIFAQNEINGLILLDVTLEDLDYMSITVLGHRKVILKGAEELRRNKRVSNVMSESLPTTGIGLASVLRTQSASNMTKSVDDTMLQDQTKQVSPLSASSSGAIDTAKTSTHWSQLEPLSNNKVSSNRSGAVNAADDSDMIDEEAERLAFMEAVNQWRQQGASATETVSISNNDISGRPKMKIEREYEKKKQSPAPAEAPGSMWHNPFAAPQSKSSLIVDDSDEEGEGDAKPVSGSHSRAAAPPKSDPQASPRGASKFDGTLDEAKEHEEFARAVEMWRNGGSASAGGAQSGTKGLAAELAKQLEQEQKESVERLHKQRQDAEQRLKAANLDLDRMKKAAHQSQAKDIEEEKDEKVSQSSSSPAVGMYTYSTPLSATKTGTSRNMRFDDEDDEDEDHLSTASTPRGDEAEQGHIEVALLESVLLNGVVTAGVDDLEESGCYVVEYDSD